MNGEVAIWKDRRDSLLASIRGVIDSIPGNSQDECTLKQLLQKLESFAQEQIDYFLVKISKSEEAPPGVSHEYALTITINQVGYDLATILQALNQRQMDEVTTASATGASDLLAEAALSAAKTYFPSGTPKVITYFQKSANIRVIPYADVAMIGVPLSCINYTMQKEAMRDFLAIPHEAGHHVFWHGEKDGHHLYNIVRKQVAELLGFPDYANSPWSYRWLYHWLEEIFADVYGARIAGRLIGLDFQDLEWHGNSAEELFYDDGKHPLPALRYQVYATTLERMGDVEGAKQLRDRWENHVRAARIHTSSFRPRGESELVTLKVAEPLLQLVVHHINDLLEDIQPVEDFRIVAEMPPQKRGSKPSRSKEKLPPLSDQYGLWAKKAPKLKRDTDAEAKAVAEKEGRFTIADCPDLDGFEWDSWRDGLRLELQQVWGLSEDDVNKIEWETVLKARGWAVKGPNGDPPKTQ